eukprot:jgi/Bigna1/45150/e_gw1.113.2.1
MCQRLTVRFQNYRPITSLRKLKSNLVDKFIALRGNVVRVSNIKPLVRKMWFECANCGAKFCEIFTDGKFRSPTSCIDNCRSRTFLPERASAVVVDFQTVRIQEIVSNAEKDQGRIPRTMECEFTDDLVDCCIPGDVVDISGIVKARKTEIRSSSSKSKNKMLYVLYIDVNAVSNGNANENGKLDIMQFSERDFEAFEEIANQKDVFKLIVNSLCPTIYGHETVKAGLCLALFGGAQKKAGANKVSVRGDSHILVVGDPGLGKSQMLRACARVAPRGVYVCGNTSTTSGLTVTMVKEGSSGDYALEAGALVLADQGCCCIDEFDKMGKEHNSLLEAMEQQSISLAKAGIVCSLSSRCAVLAAANPVGGHYDRAKTVNENLKINTALLSRFDLVFILLDRPNQARDQMLSEHVIRLHSLYNIDKGLAERLALAEGDRRAFDPLPPYLLRKYIAYARNYIHPRLDEASKQVLSDFYLKLRTEHKNIDGTPITTRQLESLIRLAEARARIDMRETVTAADARDAVEVMTESLHDVFADDDLGTIDFRSGGGGGGRNLSQAKKVKIFIKELRKEAKRRQTDVMGTGVLFNIGTRVLPSMDDFQRFLDYLNSENWILKKGAKLWKLQTGYI